MSAPLAYVGTRSRSPPSSRETGWLNTLPRISQSAMSIAESASVKMPPGPLDACGAADLRHDGFDVERVLADGQRTEPVHGSLECAAHRAAAEKADPDPLHALVGAHPQRHEILCRARRRGTARKGLIERNAHDLTFDVGDFHGASSGVSCFSCDALFACTSAGVRMQSALGRIVSLRSLAARRPSDQEKLVMTQPVKVGIVGLGRWARVLTRAASQSDKLQIVSGYSRSEEKRAAFEKELGVPRRARPEDDAREPGHHGRHPHRTQRAAPAARRAGGESRQARLHRKADRAHARGRHEDRGA